MSEDKSDKWELPDPVFRSSTGELVKPSENIAFDPEPDTLEPGFSDSIYVDPEADTLVPDAPDEPSGPASDDPLANLYAPPENVAEPAASPSPAAAEVDIEPQPMISEQFTADEIDVDPAEPVKPTGGILRTVLLTVIFLFLLGVLGVGVAFVYFYFAGRQSSGGF